MGQRHPSAMIEMKQKGQKIRMLTAYDVLMARLLDQVGVDMILVGDSLGNMFAGYDNTIPVTMDQMVYHTQAVCRGVSRALVVADMPFMSYHVSVEEAKRNAGRLIQEGGAHAVKMEWVSGAEAAIEAVISIGIPVMGHVGLTPQSVYQLGGYKVQGRSEEAVELLLSQAKALEKAGCFAVLLELVPAEVAQKVTALLSVPTIGIGAGVGCDGQVLVTQDVLGMTDAKLPKFVKPYASLHTEMTDALEQYLSDVSAGVFPGEAESF